MRWLVLTLVLFLSGCATHQEWSCLEAFPGICVQKTVRNGPAHFFYVLGRMEPVPIQAGDYSWAPLHVKPTR